MIKLSEAIKIWLSEWHLCEMCNQMHYKQISCDDEDDGRDREWNEIND